MGRVCLNSRIQAMKLHPRDEVVEPERLRAIDSEGVEYYIWHPDEPIAPGDLPLGSHLYHNTRHSTLNAIMLEGLRPSIESRHKDYSERVPKLADYRLYLWAREHDCLTDGRILRRDFAQMPDQPLFVSLRFPRSIVKGKGMWFDDRYGGVFSLYIRELISPSNLEFCLDRRFRKPFFVGSWTPLSEDTVRM